MYCMLMQGGVSCISVSMCVEVYVSPGAGRGVQNSTREALLGVEALGSPEGTARLEEPSAGQRLNKRWKGSVRQEGQERWEARTKLVETNRCRLRQKRKEKGNEA